jgi:hypothetical protein
MREKLRFLVVSPAYLADAPNAAALFLAFSCGSFPKPKRRPGIFARTAIGMFVASRHHREWSRVLAKPRLGSG